MKKLKGTISIIIVGLLLIPSFMFLYKLNKITITYKHISEEGSEILNLPSASTQIVVKNSVFEGFNAVTGLRPVEYRIYESNTEFKNLYLNQTLTEDTTIVVVWQDEEINKQKYQNFDYLIKQIERLEEISQKYNEENNSTKNATLRAMQYIKQKRYDGFAWTILAGNLETDFNAYVLNNQPKGANVDGLPNQGNIVDPKTNKEIDFVHLAAVINVLLNSKSEGKVNGDLASWGGDLCQLAIELKQTGLSGDDLQKKAYELFNGKNSSFSSSDLLADIDAYNILNLQSSLNSNSLSETIKQYYLLGNSNLRNTNYIKLVFPDLDMQGGKSKVKNDFKAMLKSRLNSNLLINIWCSTQGERYSALGEYIDMCINAMVNYFIG